MLEPLDPNCDETSRDGEIFIEMVSEESFPCDFGSSSEAAAKDEVD